MNIVKQFPTRADASKNDDPSTRPQKAYLIAHIDVADAQRYALYQDVDEDAFTRFGGHFIVRGGVQHLLEGSLKTRTIVIEFESVQVAMECYKSLENQSARAIRLSLATADAVIVEGFSDP